MVGIKSKLGAKGQITIPKPLREGFHLTKGEEVELDEMGGLIVIRKLRKEDPLEILTEFKNTFGKPFSKEEFKKIQWDKIYEEEVVERRGTRHKRIP